MRIKKKKTERRHMKKIAGRGEKKKEEDATGFLICSFHSTESQLNVRVIISCLLCLSPFLLFNVNFKIVSPFYFLLDFL